MTVDIGSALIAPEQLTSVVSLAQDLVRAPSQGGIDSYDSVIGVAEGWLRAAGLPVRTLKEGSEVVALTVDVQGENPGPQYVLDACLDTAAIGDKTAWDSNPFSGHLDAEGWLHGRGAADSKVAASIFMHLAQALYENAHQVCGTLTLLFDVDEHTGGFGGIKAWLSEASSKPAGVMIGYPGSDKVIVGGRGVYRARITVHGEAAHTGSSRPSNSAVVRAARLVQTLDTTASLRTVDPVLGLPAKATVTGIHAGRAHSWSVVPDSCEVDVDVRLTEAFQLNDAEVLLREIAQSLDSDAPAPRATHVVQVGEAWPPFRLPDSDPMVAALLAGATTVGLHPRPAVAGPSNIGCYLAMHGIPATAGFGVRYRGLHAHNEAIEVASIPRIYGAYRAAVMQLLSAPEPVTG